ncbi:hypothetical protein BGZ76_002356 [Entomortierella beljakovae]|nr:hypothetical protein BGZ76_002356 [Entomortierella beljakovae]
MSSQSHAASHSSDQLVIGSEPPNRRRSVSDTDMPDGFEGTSRSKKHKGDLSDPWEVELQRRQDAALMSSLIDQFIKKLNVKDADKSIDTSYFSTIKPRPKMPAILVSGDSENSSNGVPNDSNTFVQTYLSAKDIERTQGYYTIIEAISQLDKYNVSLATTQELVIFSTTSDYNLFIIIITKIHDVMKESLNFPIVLLHGLAVILSNTSLKPNHADTSVRKVFKAILDEILKQFAEIPSTADEHELFPLLQGLMVLLDSLVTCNLKIAACDAVYYPLLRKLDGLSSSTSPTVRFQALYTCHCLRLIGHNIELEGEFIQWVAIIFGYAFHSTDSVNAYSSDLGRAYKDQFIHRGNNDNNIGTWYQKLLFMDCIIINHDWATLNEFINSNKVRSDKLCLQGICLRLEQIAATQTQEISEGSIKALIALTLSECQEAQETSQATLDRLKKNLDSGSLSGRENALVYTASNAQSGCHSFHNYFPPTWDSYWTSQSASILLHKVSKNLQIQITQQNTREQNVIIRSEEQGVQCYIRLTNKIILRISGTSLQVQTILPQTYDSEILREALKEYYKHDLIIQRISGESRPNFDLEGCNINLAIVEGPEQRTHDKACLHFHKQSDYREPGLRSIADDDSKIKIKLDQLFNLHVTHDDMTENPPERILIQGRAGIGKTTLCKKLVYAHQKGMWRNKFEVVFWLQLRRLKQLKARNLDDLLREIYFPHHNQKDGLVMGFRHLILNGKVLFVLDGLDEIVMEAHEDMRLKSFLDFLLQQQHIIVTTRPSGVDMKILPILDIELETIGFNGHNVEKYINMAFPDNPRTANEIQEFIKEKLFMRNLVNVPVQLDVICFSWDSIPRTDHNVTMTELYQAMVHKLYRKDAIRLDKKNDDGKSLGERLILSLPNFQLLRIMDCENDYLSYLSFNGLSKDYIIEFNDAMLGEVMESIDTLRFTVGKRILPLDLTTQLKLTSFLHSADTEMKKPSDSSNITWHFLHLTFQEYFAASWIARQLQSDKMNTPETKEEVNNFINKNKLNRRFDIVWSIVAGLLNENALHDFLDVIVFKESIGNEEDLQHIIEACIRESEHKLSERWKEKFRARQQLFK